MQSLYKILHAQCRGYFIPPLPPKSLIGIIENSSEDFLRLRRADLQVRAGSRGKAWLQVWASR